MDYHNLLDQFVKELIQLVAQKQYSSIYIQSLSQYFFIAKIYLK